MASFLGNLFSGVGKAVGGVARGVGGLARAIPSRTVRRTASSGPLGLFSSLLGGSSGGRSAIPSRTVSPNRILTTGRGGVNAPVRSGTRNFGFPGGNVLSSSGTGIRNFGSSAPRSSLQAIRPPSNARSINTSAGLGTMSTRGPLGGFPGPRSVNPLTKLFGGGNPLSQLFGGGGMDKFENIKELIEKGKDIFGQVKGLFGGDGDGGGGAPGGAGAEELSALQQQVQSQGGAGPLDPLILEKMKELLGRQLQPVTGQEEQAILRDLEREEQESVDFVVDQYKNLRPGADIESDSSFRRDIQDVRDRFAKIKQDALAQARRKTQGDFDQTLLRALGLGLGQSQDIGESIGNLLSARLGIQGQQSPLTSSGLFSQFGSGFPSTFLLQ